MRVLRPLSRDPTLVVLLLAVWSLLTGLGLLLTDHAFLRSASYHVLAKLPVSERVWGSGMGIDAALLAFSARWSAVVVRASIAIFSGLGWIVFGILCVIGGAEESVFSGVGLWNATVGFALFAACVQWTGSNPPSTPDYDWLDDV